MLELDPGMMAWTWITFLVVLFILYKVALKPMISAVENREKSIREDLDTARKQRDEAESLLQRHEKMIAEAESEAQKILKENQAVAERTRQEILDKARDESARMVEKAKKEIEQQKDSAIASLKAEVADLAVGAAEKILAQTLDADKHKKVVNDYIDSMPKSAEH